MSKLEMKTEYLAAGGNRHPSAADWNISGLLAYGADRNIALWRPQNETSQGVCELLSGHTDTVNAIKFIPESPQLLLSGSVDKTVRIWSKEPSSERYTCIQTLTEHTSSVNCFGVSSRTPKIFVTGGADATVRVWSLSSANIATLQQTITITPRFFPLSLALSTLAGASDSFVLAVAGTKDIIQLYVLNPDVSPDFKLQATLSGHEGWIRSLEFTQESFDPNSDLLLSSASQDKYIRLWRIHQGVELPVAGAATASSNDPTSLGSFMRSKALSNRAHRFQAQGLDFSTTFEALLFGHEDWIYSTKWRALGGKLQLLSASADNSLAIWESDESTGVWVTVARMGEISSEKGSTTATGSTGGFWTGLWSPSGETVVSLGRTGSWRLWDHNLDTDRWEQSVGISGHTQSVTGIAWSKDGNYLLSTSSDQTTRLHAKWKREDLVSWHEMARPQIHGYDLNCIDSLGTSSFVSGADEKLLRVFSEPKAVATMLESLCGFSNKGMDTMPDAANMPVLGLSNKAIAIDADTRILTPNEQEFPNPNANPNAIDTVDPLSAVFHSNTNSISHATHPPLEDHLSRYTLWPEIEKLYGHGYEISALATSHDGTLVATACKASSIDHAVIRIFETATWHEVKPPLVAHTLTVARLSFSSCDGYLLSVGRDRGWVVWGREGEAGEMYVLKQANMKGHARMILDAAWAPSVKGSDEKGVFATAGRDKTVKIWRQGEGEGEGGYTCQATISEENPVTAIDFTSAEGRVYLAVGTEVGKVKIYCVGGLGADGDSVVTTGLVAEVPGPHAQKNITQLAWKPTQMEGQDKQSQQEDMELAIAGEDSSLRVYSFCSKSIV